MIQALFIVYSVLLLVGAVGCIYLIHRAYIGQIDALRSERKDLLDRLLQKNNLPPTEVNLTEKYEQKAEREQIRREHPQPRNADPLKAVREKWKIKDLAAASRGDDVSRSRNLIN